MPQIKAVVRSLIISKRNSLFEVETLKKKKKKHIFAKHFNSSFSVWKLIYWLAANLCIFLCLFQHHDMFSMICKTRNVRPSFQSTRMIPALPFHICMHYTATCKGSTWIQNTDIFFWFRLRFFSQQIINSIFYIRMSYWWLISFW